MPGITQQQATEYRPDQEGEAPDGAEQAQRRAAIFETQARGDHGAGDGEDTAGAEALDRAAGIQHHGFGCDDQQ